MIEFPKPPGDTNIEEISSLAVDDALIVARANGSPAQILAEDLVVSGVGVTAHGELTGIGVNGHAAIDAHLANTDLHGGGAELVILDPPQLLLNFPINSTPYSVDLPALCPDYSHVYLSLSCPAGVNDYFYGIGNYHDVDILLNTRRLLAINLYYTSAAIYLPKGVFWANVAVSNININYPNSSTVNTDLHLLGGILA